MPLLYFDSRQFYQQLPQSYCIGIIHITRETVAADAELSNRFLQSFTYSIVNAFLNPSMSSMSSVSFVACVRLQGAELEPEMIP